MNSIKVYKNILDKSYAPFVDKLTAKGIVKHICGDRIEVAKVVRILSSPDDLTEADFQEHRMVKASHGSGWNIILHPSLSLNDVKMKLPDSAHHLAKHIVNDHNEMTLG